MAPSAVQLSGSLASQIRQGLLSFDIASLPATGPTPQPGRPLLLLDPRSETLGTAVADPDNELVRVLSREYVETFGRKFFDPLVEKAFAWRRSMDLGGEGQECFRLINAEGDGLSGFTAACFADHVVLYADSRGLLSLGRVLAESILDVVEPRGLVLKVRARHGTKPGKVSQETCGSAPSERVVAHEAGVPFEIHPLGGLNVGLFTDMRLHRQGLSRFSAGRRVLNLFAYTSTLSVVAARHGARSVTSVDLASGVLKWARRNFELSGLSPDSDSYRFEGGDVMRFVRQEVGQGAHYDLIIMDPPTFSSARPTSWSMKNDYPKLIAAAADLLPTEGGILWVSANVRKGRGVERHVEEAIKRVGRSARVVEIGGLPPDYPTPLLSPQARYLQVVKLWVEGSGDPSSSAGLRPRSG